MQELREPLQNSLKQNGFYSELENQSDNELGFKVKKTGYNSYLRLFRTRHRPLLVEIEVDYNYYSAQKRQIKEQQKRAHRAGQDRSLRGSLWRVYWLYIIFGGIIASVAYLFSGFFVTLIEVITPGWSSTARAILLVGISVIIIILYVLAIPKIHSKRNEYAHQIDQEVIEIVKNALQDIKDSEIESETVKCWSCFEEISIGTKKCPNCGADQT